MEAGPRQPMHMGLCSHLGPGWCSVCRATIDPDADWMLALDWYGMRIARLESELQALIQWRRSFTHSVLVEALVKEIPYLIHVVADPKGQGTHMRSHYPVQDCNVVYPDGTTECQWLLAHGGLPESVKGEA